MLKNLIILAVVAGVILFVGSSMKKKNISDQLQSSVSSAIAGGRFSDAIAILEKNENRLKRAEDYHLFAYSYMIIVEMIRPAPWKAPMNNQYNLPNTDSLYLKAIDLMRKSIALAEGDFKEQACIYLSSIYLQKDDREEQIQSLELAASSTESAVRKSYYYFYIADQILKRVRLTDLRDEDRRLKRQASDYLEKSLTAYPDNYEVLMYMSNIAESTSEKTALYTRAKTALPKYEVDSKKDNLGRFTKMLAVLDPDNYR